MHLYFAPMACSLASRMALYRAGLGEETEFHAVRLDNKTLADGSYFRQISPKGQVPALLTRDRQLLTENCAILQYIADLAPDSGLAPAPGTFQRLRLQEWLSFLSTELHKGIFATIFHPAAPEEARAFARTVLAPVRLGWLEQQLEKQPFLLQDCEFTVADAYLVTILNWFGPAGLELDAYPHLKAYQARVLPLEGVSQAQREEYRLWSAA